MRKMLAVSGRIIVIAIILTAVQIAANLFMGMGDYAGHAGWVLLSNVLIVLVLACCIMRARATRMRLIAAVFLVYWGIYVFNTNVEALFFGLDIPARESAGIIGLGTVLAVIGAIILTFLFGAKDGGETTSQSNAGKAITVMGYSWRSIVCALLYVLLYLIAGAFAYPYLRDFYADRAIMPSADRIVLMQVIRGLLYVAFTVPLVRILQSKRMETAVLIGFCMSLLGGISPLLLPNPYMPPHIRMVHGIEVGISNYMYGFIIGWLFWGRARRTKRGDMRTVPA